MKYLLLAYDESITPQGKPDDAGQPGFFQGVQAGTSASILDGLVSLSAPLRDSLVGYRILDARDLNDAIRVASRAPEALAGRIEIWPISDEKGEANEPPTCSPATLAEPA